MYTFNAISYPRPPWMRIALGRVLATMTIGTCALVRAQDTAGLGGRAGRQIVELGPTTQRSTSRGEERSIDLGGWTYHAGKVPVPRDGVPWELVAIPTSPLAEGWRKAMGLEAAGFSMAPGRGDVPVQNRTLDSPIPIVEVPDVLWKQWMSADLHEVVGIHFHEVVSNDIARILFTLHRVPSDDAPAGELDRGRPAGSTAKAAPASSGRGTRIEATLLSPILYCLDQAIAVRKDALKKELAGRRGQHELGHAEVSQSLFFAVMAGPQDWKPGYCGGRRSRIEYYWRREKIGRAWEGYRRGVGELATLRTSVILVPPTRWSMMLPIPPERVTQKHLQAFNDVIVNVSQSFVVADAAAQEQFHAQHGAYEDAGGP